jgi:hypothetical protein
MWYIMLTVGVDVGYDICMFGYFYFVISIDMHVLGSCAILFWLDTFVHLHMIYFYYIISFICALLAKLFNWGRKYIFWGELCQISLSFFDFQTNEKICGINIILKFYK